MNCLSAEDLARVALGLEVSRDQQAHAQTCPACRAGVAEARAAAQQLSQAYGAFDREHVAGHERLLAEIAGEEPASFRFTNWMGGLTTMQRIGLGAAAIAAVVLVVLLRLGLAPNRASAAEQVAESMREAKSYKVTMETGAGKNFKVDQIMYWRAPGTYRLETNAPPRLKDEVMIVSAEGPGLELKPDEKTYRRLPARQGQKSPLLMPETLKKYSGQADRQLPEKEIGGHKMPGFEIDAQRMDPDIYPGKVNVWYDPTTNLPVYVAYDFKLNDQAGSVTWHDFEWNVALDAKLFDTAPPEGYTDKTPAATPEGERVEHIRQALRTYAQLSKGHYPQVKIVYGDITNRAMLKMMGVKGRPTAEQIRTNEYRDIITATRGFATLNGIQRDNADAAYHGMTVGPKDAGKVVLRWKLDDGKYQVMYGDLRDEVVTAERLQELEKGVSSK